MFQFLTKLSNSFQLHGKIILQSFIMLFTATLTVVTLFVKHQETLVRVCSELCDTVFNIASLQSISNAV